MYGIFGTQNGIGFFLYLTEGKEVTINSIDYGSWEAKDKITGALIDGVEIWYWPCL